VVARTREALRGLAGDSAVFEAKAYALRLTVEQHVYHEACQLFPQAEVVLAEQVEDLRDERQDLKDQWLGS